jgi:hypothetical protein
MAEDAEESSEALRARALERISQGKLPRAKAARTWGGLGSGLSCDLCDTAILATQPEFEVQTDLAAPAETVRFHRRCHTIWDLVRQELVPEPAQWTPVATQLPAPGDLVEARLSLGGGRAIVLDVIYVGDSAGAPSWLNATTRAALPVGWDPVEWRQRATAVAAHSEVSTNSRVPKSA